MPPELSPFERLQLVRDGSRPRARAIFEALLDDAFELHGDRQGQEDGAVVVRLGALRTSKRRIVAVGQNHERICPSGFRKAVRAFELAGRLRLPVLTVIDTRGADPRPESEAMGVASAIARTFAALLECPSPTVALLTGEGGSGGALAMAVCDRILAAENSVFSVIAPEAAAAILHRDASQAPDLAERLRITASDLEALGLVDRLIAEPDGVLPLSDAGSAVEVGFEELLGIRPSSRLRQRAKRWRELSNEHLGAVTR